MISRKDLEKIKKITKDFFEKTTIDVEVEIGRPEEDTVPIDIKMEEPQLLIGEGGQTLLEIQHLLRIILRKQIPSLSGQERKFFIDLDIQNYKKKKIDYLKEMALSLADEVSLTKKEKILAPMPAYERRIIHLELAGRKDVITESVGQEPERKIVIKPCP
jgi:spoIIIJ-associated protein